MSQAAAAKDKQAPARTAGEIEADLAATRDRLVSTIAEIEDRVSPKNVMQRQKEKAQAYYLSDAGPRWDRVAYTAAAVGAGLIGLRVVTRTLRWALSLPKEKPIPSGLVFLPVPREQVAEFTKQLPTSESA
ncbi:MAG: DUF3618 domain-containing protein [Candidatus Nanopelagicales bacterium]